MQIQVACHAHSEWSYDAKWTLEALSKKFAADGYRVLMMTEHDRGFSPERLRELRAACEAVSSDSFLVVPGIEYSDAANQVHVLVWGEVPFLGEGLPTSDMLRQVKSCNGVAVWAHPSRRNAWQNFEPSWSEALLGIELWNRKYDGWAPSETAGPLLLRAGAVPFVGLDFHTAKQSFPLAMVLELNEAVSEQAILECMRARRLHARAFGMPLDRALFRKAVPVMGIAEQARRRAASVVKQARKRF